MHILINSKVIPICYIVTSLKIPLKNTTEIHSYSNRQGYWKSCSGLENILYFLYHKNTNFNPIQDGRRGGGGKKVSPTSFSPVISTNVGTRPQNFLTFSFNPFD